MNEKLAHGIRKDSAHISESKPKSAKKKILEHGKGKGSHVKATHDNESVEHAKESDKIIVKAVLPSKKHIDDHAHNESKHDHNKSSVKKRDLKGQNKENVRIVKADKDHNKENIKPTLTTNGSKIRVEFDTRKTRSGKENPK